MPEAIAEIDGMVFHGRFAGFAQPLEVMLPDGDPVSLRPWPYRAHLAALSESLFAGEAGLVLDTQYFASRVLAWSDVPSAHLDTLAPLALWWAAGGDTVPPAEPGDLGATRATLRPWTERERLAALLAARHGDAFNAPVYLDSMVRASVIGFSPAARLDDLDSHATARLLDAVVALNAPDPATDPLLGGVESAEAARAVLALCRAVGWTPAQVLATPAVEIDRLRHLLALAEPGTSRPPSGAHHPGLHPPGAHPPGAHLPGAQLPEGDGAGDHPSGAYHSGQHDWWSRPAWSLDRRNGKPHDPHARDRHPRLEDHPDAVVIRFEDEP